jgi:hypothetical protein
VEQLNVSRENLDQVSGLPSGYSGKLLAPYARKKIGQLSLGLLLKAAGVKMALIDDPEKKRRAATVSELDSLLKAAGLMMVLVEDQEALARVQPLFSERDSKQVRLNNSARTSKGSSRSSKKRASAECVAPPCR